MSGDTVECFNCGRANPSWAQVCRSCGVPIKAVAARSGPQPAIPTDQDSLISIGAAVGSIVVAIGVGLFLSGIIPEAPPIPDPTPTPGPSISFQPSASFLPSPLPSGATPVPSVALPGTVSFGLGLNRTTREIVNPSDTFGPGQVFAHSIALSGPFGVNQIQEEVIRIEADGALTVVQQREGSNLDVNADAQIAGYSVSTNSLISGDGSWGPGNYILRVYRGVELIAEGRFTLTN
jgi:hypothetical protein